MYKIYNYHTIHLDEINKNIFKDSYSVTVLILPALVIKPSFLHRNTSNLKNYLHHVFCGFKSITLLCKYIARPLPTFNT